MNIHYYVDWDYITDMPPDLYQKFSKCNKRHRGHMMQEVQEHRSRPAHLTFGKRAIGIFAYRYNPFNLAQHPDEPIIGATLLTNYDFLIYVQARFRNIGIGTELLEEAAHLANTKDYKLDRALLTLQ